MSDVLVDLRRGGIDLLAAVALLVSLYQVAVRPVMHLWQTSPWRSGAGLPLTEWLVKPEWVIVFSLVNAAVFAFSLFGALPQGAESWKDVILEDPLVTAQVGALLISAGFLVGATASTSGAIPGPSANTRLLFASALLLALGANMLALVDSLQTWLTGNIGPWHFGVWMVENFGCIAFYGILLAWLVLKKYATLASATAARLWWLAGLLFAATTADLVLPTMY